MGMLQCLCQPISRLRNDNQVDMIGHEAIANQRDFVEDEVFPQQLEVDRAVSIAIQHEASPISSCVKWCGTSAATTRANRPIA